MIYADILLISLLHSFGIVMSAKTALYKIQFHLPDNTPKHHLVGTVLKDIPIQEHQFTRAMLNPDGLFTLNLSGLLHTRDPIDRDQICTRYDCCSEDYCLLELEAYLFSVDPNPLYVKVIVIITDENDNAPAFPRFKSDSGSWTISIPENALVGSRHKLPQANDIDSPRFGVHHYQLSSPNKQFSFMNTSPFSLSFNPSREKTTPLLTPQLQLDAPLDREVTSSYNLSLIVEDAGSPPLTSSLLIHVVIQDVNDNSPTFKNIPLSGASITIPENISIGTVIFTFDVEDIDQSQNGQTKLSIDWTSSFPGSNRSTTDLLSRKYSLNSQNGQLRVTKSLDYENELERRLALLVKATDQGSPSLTSTATVTINLEDVNDNNPRIMIAESDRVGEPAAQINLVENDPTIHLVRLISIYDADFVSKDKIHCKLDDKHVNDFNLTAYSSTMYGLSNKRAFDFDTEADENGNLIVRMECIDHGGDLIRKSWNTLHIAMRDVNDNRPQFSQLNYRLDVYEGIRIGTRLGQVFATDLDRNNQFGKISYELSSLSNHSVPIRIDSTTGVLYTNSVLDRETSSEINFQVTAKDGGGLTNTTSLTLSILDVNDNIPLYTGSLQFHISESSPIGSIIEPSLSYNDLDLGENSTVNMILLHLPDRNPYSMSLEEKKFGIQQTGDHTFRIVSNIALDREIQSEYRFVLSIADKGLRKSLSSTTTLTILVDDINDNPPRLVYPRNASVLNPVMTPYSWINGESIPADSPPYTLLLTIQAKDLDADGNASISFHLVSKPSVELTNDYLQGYDYFTLDEKLGHLYTFWGESEQNTFHNETVGRFIKKPENPKPGLYILYVQLRDGGTPPLTTQCYFIVNVSEAVGGFLRFAWFSETNFSNTVVLTLIMVCSITLIVSLLGAIVWVRFRRIPAINISEHSFRSHCLIDHQTGTTGLCDGAHTNGYLSSTSKLKFDGQINLPNGMLDWNNDTLNYHKSPSYYGNLHMLPPHHIGTWNETSQITREYLPTTDSYCMFEVPPTGVEFKSTTMNGLYDPSISKDEIGFQHETCNVLSGCNGGGTCESDSGVDIGSCVITLPTGSVVCSTPSYDMPAWTNSVRLHHSNSSNYRHALPLVSIKDEYFPLRDSVGIQVWHSTTNSQQSLSEQLNDPSTSV